VQFLPCGFFVLLYSILPHKELRFILPAVPVINLVVATGALRLWQNRDRDMLSRALWILGASALIASVALSVGFLYVSSWNYPGGHALAQFHTIASAGSSGSLRH